MIKSKKKFMGKARPKAKAKNASTGAPLGRPRTEPTPKAPRPPPMTEEEWKRTLNHNVPSVHPITKKKWLYGRTWTSADVGASSPDPPILWINLFCFGNYENIRLPRSPGKFHLFRAIVEEWFNHPSSSAKFDFQDFSIRMAEAACKFDYLAIAGAASTGKSDFAAAYALVCFMANPQETLILITSTSLKGAGRRVWGAIQRYYNARPGLPGKLINSAGTIRYEDPSGKRSGTEQMGITLIAAEPKNSVEASNKLIGAHAKTVILIADELAALSGSVLKAVDNLANNPRFQMIGMSNPSSRYDNMGQFCEPEAGWESDSIDINTKEWKTKWGWCVRLDGLDSPNLIEGRTIYPYLMTQERWDAAIMRAGPAGATSSEFMRMNRGYFPDSVSDECVFSQADFVFGKAFGTAVWGIEAPLRLASLDPSFSSGGDLCILTFASYGKDKDGVMIVQRDEALPLDHNVKDPLPRTQQLAQMVVRECRNRGVRATHFIMDSTGGGSSFADTIATEWGTQEFLRVNFSESPSTAPMSPIDPTPANEACADKSSELWYCAVDLLRAGHLRGFDKVLAAELASRRHDANTTRKRKVESKVIMKARTGSSPDYADSFVLIIDLVRRRLRMKRSASPGTTGNSPTWKNLLQKKSSLLTHGDLET